MHLLLTRENRDIKGCGVTFLKKNKTKTLQQPECTLLHRTGKGSGLWVTFCELGGAFGLSVKEEKVWQPGDK